MINNISMLGENYIWKEIFIVCIKNGEVKKEERKYANIIYNKIIYILSRCQSIRSISYIGNRKRVSKEKNGMLSGKIHLK